MTKTEISKGDSIEIQGKPFTVEKVGSIHGCPSIEIRGSRGGRRSIDFRPDGTAFMTWGGYRSRKQVELDAMLIGSTYWTRSGT